MTLAAFDIDGHVGALAFANVTPSGAVGAFQKDVVKGMLDRAANP